jgi:hypothetical protein
MRKHSKRRTSKVWLAITQLLSWGAIFYAINTQQGSVVVASLVGLIGSSLGLYMGVGHMDFREMLRNRQDIDDESD